MFKFVLALLVLSSNSVMARESNWTASDWQQVLTGKTLELKYKSNSETGSQEVVDKVWIEEGGKIRATLGADANCEGTYVFHEYLVLDAQISCLDNAGQTFPVNSMGIYLHGVDLEKFNAFKSVKVDLFQFSKKYGNFSFEGKMKLIPAHQQ